MIYNTVELHNIEELRKVEGREGLSLQRIPDDVNAHVSPEGQLRFRQPTNAEIRFCLEGTSAKVTLSSSGTSEVSIYQGDFFKSRQVIGEEKKTFELELDQRLLQFRPEERAQLCFDPCVIRLVLGGLSLDTVFLHDASGDMLRPPDRQQLPETRLLAYGTSITQGFCATHSGLGYAAQTAWHLKADLINLGLAGTALCEPELADYIASRQDWDIAVLALSVNMIGAGFSISDFYDRVAYMVDTIASSEGSRPIFCVTIYPCALGMGEDMAPHQPKAPVEEYRKALRDAVRACGCPNAHIVEGPDILSDIRGLTHDLVHPADNGMTLMGANLARTIRSRLENH
jgi:hypothetical protein